MASGGESKSDIERTQGLADDERERRQRALRELARQSVAQSSADTAAPPAGSASAATRPASLRPPRRSRRGAHWLRSRGALVALALVLIVVAAGAGVVYVRQRVGATHPAPPVRTLAARLSISPAADGIAICSGPHFGFSSAVAWSPDGQSLAVLGNAGKCAESDPVSYAYQPGIVGIYSAATGALTGRFNPDLAITAALHLTPPQLPAPNDAPTTPPRGDTSHQIITYDGVLWSPDGARLALLFEVDYFFGVQVQGNGAQYNTAPWYGVATMTPSGTDPVVIAGPPPVFSADHPAPPPWEFDLAQHRYLLPPSAPTNVYGVPRPQPVGLGYTWNADGTLAIQQALAPNSVPPAPRPGPVGNPTHDASFTIWQPGRITSDPQHGEGVYQYSWQFVAWSPDGRYLLLPTGTVGAGFGIGFGELLVPRKYGPTPQELAAELNPAEVYLPVRDAALRAVLQHDITGSIAWSPNGRRLVVIPEIVHGTDDQGADLTGMRLYDCASGYEIARFTSDVAGGRVYQPAIAWSPNGTQIMVFAQTETGITITLWHVS